MIAAAYIGLSIEERDDVAVQRARVVDYCQERGWVLEQVVIDQKSTKLPWRNRGLADLLHFLKPGDVLITPKLIGLSRSVQDIFDFLAEAARCEVVVRIINPDIVIDGHLKGPVLSEALGLAAEIERVFNGQRARSAVARKKSEGQKLGRPIGKGNAKTKLTGREAEVNDYLSQGLKAPAIARRLGVHPETIRRYAKNRPAVV